MGKKNRIYLLASAVGIGGGRHGPGVEKYKGDNQRLLHHGTRELEGGLAVIVHRLSLGRGGKDSEREVTFLWQHSKLMTKLGFEPVSCVLGTLISNCLEFQNWTPFSSPQLDFELIKGSRRSGPKPLCVPSLARFIKATGDYLACLRPEASWRPEADIGTKPQREGMTEVVESLLRGLEPIPEPSLGSGASPDSRINWQDDLSQSLSLEGCPFPHPHKGRI